MCMGNVGNGPDRVKTEVLGEHTTLSVTYRMACNCNWVQVNLNYI